MAGVRLHPSFRLISALVLLTPLTADAAPQPSAEQRPGTDFHGDPLPPGALARMGSVRLRQYDADLAFSADGKTLISGHMEVNFWDAASGRRLRRTRLEISPGVELEARIAGLSPDGRMAAAFIGGDVCLFDTTTSATLRRLPASGGGVGKIAFSADGKRLAWFLGGGDDYALHVWDLMAGVERLALNGLKRIEALALSSDGKLLAFRGGTHTIHIWDTDKRKELATGPLEGDSWALSPDGRTVAAVNFKGAVTLWQTADLKKMATLQPASRVGVAYLNATVPMFSPDGKLLAVAGLDPIIVWDVAARKELLRLSDWSARKLLFAPDGKTLAVAGWFEIHLWDMTTGKQRHPRPGHDGAVTSVAVSPDGRVVASVGGDGRKVLLWDAETGKPRLLSPRHIYWIRSVAFAADGRLQISGVDGVLRLLDAETGAEGRRFVIPDGEDGRQDHGIAVSNLSPDGQHLAAVSVIWDKQSKKQRAQITSWDTSSGDQLVCRPLRGGLDAAQYPRFTPDGECLCVQGVDRLTLQDTKTGEERAAILGDLGDPVAFSRDGQLVAVGIHQTRITAEGKRAAYTPLGLRLAEVATGEEIFHLDGRFEFAALSPNGRVLVTTDADALRVWDMRAGEALLVRPWPEGFVRRPPWTAIDSLAFRPDSRAVVTGMNDGTILVWDLAPESGSKAAGRELGRKELDTLWSDLLGSASAAHRAVHRLAASPEQSLLFLAEHMRPAVAVDGKHLDKLLADLDSDVFAAREAATRELTEMGEQSEPALRRVLENKPSLEVRNRARSILAASRKAPPSEGLRTRRAIRVLEAIGTSEARRLLRMVASGAAEARETREARKALERLTLWK